MSVPGKATAEERKGKTGWEEMGQKGATETGDWMGCAGYHLAFVLALARLLARSGFFLTIFINLYMSVELL